MFKKLFAFATALVVWLSSLTFATYTSSPTWTTRTDYNFNFKATLVNWDVQMSRNQFVLPYWYSRTYWKVVRSQSNSSPVYPDDGYIKYEWNQNFTSRTDTNPPAWKSYYRVCAITSKSDSKVRFCSNVVAVTAWSTSDTTYTDTTTTTTSTVDKYAYLYPTVDKLVTNFMAKLEAKYPGDYASQKTTLQTLINNVTPLATNSLFAYLKNKLDEQMQILNLSSLLDI